MTIGDTLRHLGLHVGDDPRTDGDLLTAFVRARDELAFAELLRRHGPTVLGVCRRILGHSHDADDAFQAVFLVLARKAESVRPPGMVGNWLYGVAVRTANKARVMNAKRAKRAATARERADENPLPGGRGSSPDTDTLAVIDAELAALPAVYRAVFVTCEVNGRSRSEAARELGWPEGTVAARLAKARELLAARLTRRGVTLTAGLFAAASLPSALASETIGAVRELLAVGAAHSLAPVAQTLSDEVVKSMSGIKLKLAAVGVAVAVLTAGTVLLAGPGEKPGPRPERKPMTNAPVLKAASEWKEATPITFADGGRVTSVAYSPSGETLAVCRDSGQINFYKAKTRERYTGMAVKHDPKVNPNVQVGTVTALAFRPTPHPKLGDVFAVTHKNGVIVGTVNIGLLVDDAPVVVGLPPNWQVPGYDPHQVTWLRNEGSERLAATNGKEARIRLGDVGKDAPAMIAYNWSGYEHKPAVLAAVPGEDKVLFTVNTQMKRAEDDSFDVWVRSLVHSSLSIKLAGHKSRPTCGVISKDGKLAVTGDEDGTLIVWEGEQFEEKRRVELGAGVVQLALAADGKTVAALRAFTDTTLLGTSGRTLINLELHVFDVTAPPKERKPLWSARNVLSDAKTITGPASLAFSPDGKTLLVAFADPYIADNDAKSMGVRVWELVPKK
jgi:RNA polymerase sigma factor (sigma-70 family)